MIKLERKTQIFFTLLVGLGAGLFFNIFHTLGYNFENVPGDLGDSRLVNYFLEHNYKWFSGDIKNYWDAPMMYPEKNTLTFSENMIGTAPIYSLFRFIGLSRPDSYSFWIVAMHLLNYLAAYFVLLKMVKNPYSASLGAFVFAFSIALNSQIVATHNYPRFPIPIALLMVYLFYDKLQIKYFFLALLVIVFQFYAAIYHGFFLSTFTAIILISVLITKRDLLIIKIKNKRWVIGILSSILLNLFLLSLLMYPYYQRSLVTMKNTYEIVEGTLPTLSSYVFSVPTSLSWNWLSFHGNDLPIFYIHYLFPGIFALGSFVLIALLLIRGFIKKNHSSILFPDKRLMILMLASFLVVLTFMRFGEISFYKILFNIPGFNVLRNLCRIINIQLFFFGLGLSLVSLLVFNKAKRFGAVLFIFVLALLVADNYTTTFSNVSSSKTIREARSDELVAKLKHLPKGTIFSYEPDSIIDYDFAYHVDAMIAAQELDMICVNGYSGGIPEHYYEYGINLNEKGRKIYFEGIKFSPDTIFIVK